MCVVQGGYLHACISCVMLGGKCVYMCAGCGEMWYVYMSVVCWCVCMICVYACDLCMAVYMGSMHMYLYVWYSLLTTPLLSMTQCSLIPVSHASSRILNGKENHCVHFEWRDKTLCLTWDSNTPLLSTPALYTFSCLVPLMFPVFKNPIRILILC